MILLHCAFNTISTVTVLKVKVKEADLYSAFIEVPYTQGAQVRITQCYLQITPYLPLPRVLLNAAVTHSLQLCCK